MARQVTSLYIVFPARSHE